MRCRIKARRLRSKVHAKPSHRLVRLIRSGDGRVLTFLTTIPEKLAGRSGLWKMPHPMEIEKGGPSGQLLS